MDGGVHDVAIIGGGIVGCSALFDLSRQGFSCILMEKNSEIMGEASAGNSGMLHTGFDAPLDSLEMHCIKSCQMEIFGVLKNLKVPYNKCGTVLVAWSEKEKYEIPALYHKTKQADLGDDISLLTSTDLHQLEPGLKTGSYGALHVPGETMVDSWLLGIALAHHARNQGAKILTNCEVIQVGDGVIDTTRGKVRAKVIVNCAGLYGDFMDSLQGVQSFSIAPRKGQYSVFGKEASHLFNSIIFPIPTEKSKGIAVFKSVYSNVFSGPTAVDIQNRTLPISSDQSTHTILTEHAQNLIPDLSHFDPIGDYVGLRPATQFKDYQIKAFPHKKWISIGGIRSTGVSACLGIAKYLSETLHDKMEVEPSYGTTGISSDMTWQVCENGRAVIFDYKTVYRAKHPMFLFGYKGYGNKL